MMNGGRGKSITCSHEIGNEDSKKLKVESGKLSIEFHLYRKDEK